MWLWLLMLILLLLAAWKKLSSAFWYYFSWFIVKSNALCIANCLSDSVLILIIQLQLHISDFKANIRFTAYGWISQIGTICVALIVVTSCNTTFWQLTLRFITSFHFKSYLNQKHTRSGVPLAIFLTSMVNLFRNIAYIRKKWGHSQPLKCFLIWRQEES